MNGIKKSAAGAVLAGALMFAGGVAPASAVTQDGLVNINIGDVTVLENVRVAVAANILANVCVNDVNVLAIDAGASAQECVNRGGRTIATVTNN
ncbi:hypothetical protein [Pseudarthrobacter sp. NS4]|uniref:hypothetical protein n=1 Tax=Pseudarthrobacter sp. NS4 TaxID=2973976 RepID=UPI00216275FC|nr:hypothetical protein [Pseudarthrobacter sp. NS4]